MEDVRILRSNIFDVGIIFSLIQDVNNKTGLGLGRESNASKNDVSSNLLAKWLLPRRNESICRNFLLKMFEGAIKESLKKARRHVSIDMLSRG
jgi:hypothetical protein